jgi:hypothetical protein
METFGDGEVVTVVLTGGDPPQVLTRFAARAAFGADRIGAAQREVANGARTWLRAAQLGKRVGELRVDRHLNPRLDGRHFRKCITQVVQNIHKVALTLPLPSPACERQARKKYGPIKEKTKKK